MTGYFRLCGLDPKKTNRTTCIEYRMDRPLSRVEEGHSPVVVLSILVVNLSALLFIIFIIFLDFAVLRRVVKLSEAIRNQSAKHHNALHDMEGLDPDVKGKRGKTSDGSGKLSDEAGGPVKGDEIKNLKAALEQNNYRLRRRIEAVNSVAKMERLRILKHKQAMQLLSLWCDRSELFPGLRPNAALLRYEPKRSLDDLLSNPLAVEYLKSHCDRECTLENLFFLLDVSWLTELEMAEDAEEDSAKRKEIHTVVSDTASTIIQRYIVEDAPQQINISASAFKTLRGRGASYKRGMFKEAVSEVKLMLNTDILPRFQSSLAYTALSENMYIDSFTSTDDSDFSSESVSTAGSVLSDETDSGVAGMVAFNFKNLYMSFGTETDLMSTCTNESSLIEDPYTGSTVAGTKATTVSSSTKEDVSEDTSSSDESEDSSD